MNTPNPARVPKAAHRSQPEKVSGYLNAAQVSLGIAARLSHGRQAKSIEALIPKIEALKER